MGCCPSQKDKSDAPPQTIEIKRNFDSNPPPVKNTSQSSIPAQKPEEEKKADDPNQTMIKSIVDLVKAVLLIAQKALGRNQITKILLGTIKSIEPAFKLLRESNVVSSQDLLTKLCTLMKELKTYCEEAKKNLKKTSAKKGGKVLRDNQGSIKIVGDFNDKINGIIFELKKPVTKETKINEKKAEEIAKENAKDLESVMKNLADNQINVVGLSQNDLTNEDAFAFWMESYPTKYMVPIDEFADIFKQWLKSKKNIELSEENMAVVMRLINETTSKKKDLEISAKELNTFFENLPYDVDWIHLTEIENEVADEQRQRVAEVEQMRKDNEGLLRKKIEAVEMKESQEEKDLANNEDLIRFFVKGAWVMEKSDSEEYLKKEFMVRNVFINAKEGEILCFGSDENGDEFKITGEMTYSGMISLQKSYSNGKDVVNIEGNLSENYIDGTLAFISESGDFVICLDVDHWFGYYFQEETPKDMLVCFKRVENKMTGVSLDVVGAAFWSGIVTETELHMVKQMVKQHSIKYDGILKKSGIVTEIQGKWDIEGYTGGFLLSHNDEQE